MSDQAAPEPTMEEILASIRRIISEDDAPAAEPEPAPAPEVAPEPEPVVAAAPEPPADDVLELTDRIEPPAETVGDIDVYEEVAPEPAPPPPAPAPVAVVADDETLVSEPSSAAAASAFSNLTASIPLPPVGRTLEDLTRELMRPLLKAWLDENLPHIVEVKVAEEVERIARLRVR